MILILRSVLIIYM